MAAEFLTMRQPTARKTSFPRATVLAADDSCEQPSAETPHPRAAAFGLAAARTERSVWRAARTSVRTNPSEL